MSHCHHPWNLYYLYHILTWNCGWSQWRLRSDRNCWFCSFCRFCCARVGGQKLQKQLILGSWRYRSYWSSLSGICDFCSSRVGGQNPQNPLKKREFPDEYIFGATRFFSSFCVICPPTLAQQNPQILLKNLEFWLNLKKCQNKLILWILLCQGRGAESTETTEFWWFWVPWNKWFLCL